MYDSVYGMTDAGMLRDGNEDAFLLLPDRQVYIVSDGMGGHNAGEIASQTAVNKIKDFFSRLDTTKIPGDSVKEYMLNAVHQANKEVWEKSHSANEYSGMGCTLAMVFIGNGTLHTCHVGDSRVYLLDKANLVQITTDHSVVNELVQIGQMSQDEARHSYLKNQLTQALGTSSVVHPGYNSCRLKKNDTVLICTDGLWDMLTDKNIQKTLKQRGSPESICKQLIGKANEAGGDDNITVVVSRITGE